MSSAGNLKCRFFWERIGEDYLIYDRDRGAGCFGENYVATARDGTVAEIMCGLMNQNDAKAALAEVMVWIDNWGPAWLDDDEWPDTRAKVERALS